MHNEWTEQARAHAAGDNQDEAEAVQIRDLRIVETATRPWTSGPAMDRPLNIP